jgi:hypothetical protein
VSINESSRRRYSIGLWECGGPYIYTAFARRVIIWQAVRRMDSLTLGLLIFVFAVALGLYFLTAPLTSPPVPPPLPEKPLAPSPLTAIRISPALLRQNVAVARLMRM